MKNLRRIHLYLGCFFSPMLILFAITGAGQMLGIRMGIFTEIHLRHYGSIFSVFLSVLMAISIVVTALLGIIMALRMTGNRKSVNICLIAGVLVPTILLLLGGSMGKKKRAANPTPPPVQVQPETNSVEAR